MEASLVRAVRLCLTTVVSEHFGNISEQGDLLKRLAGTDLQLQSKGDLVRQQLKMWRALLALRLGANQPLFAAGAARLHCCFCNPPCSQCHSCTLQWPESMLEGFYLSVAHRYEPISC